MGRVFFETAGWRVPCKVLLCCVRRDWRRRYWEGEEEEVFARGGEVYLGVDDV